MLSDDELLKKCGTNAHITKEDMGIDDSHDCPYECECNECDGKFCRGMYFVHKSGLTIYNTACRGGKGNFIERLIDKWKLKMQK